MDAADPERDADQGVDDVPKHDASDHFHEYSDEREVGDHVQLRGKEEADESWVCILEGFGQVGGVAEEAG